MNREKSKDLRKEAEEKQEKIVRMCGMMRLELLAIKKFKGHSPEFKLLEIAISKFEQQAENNSNRLRASRQIREAKNEIKQMQESLNRERKLRHELEKKVEEASVSGGLFVQYVKRTLGI